MKKTLYLMLVILLLASCSVTPEASDGQDFVDDAGRSVTLPETITKVSPSGNPAQIVLYTLAPDKLLNWAQHPGDIIAKYMDQKYVELPEYGAFYSRNSNINLEELIKAAPDVIIDIGEIKDDIAESMDKIQEQTGIPTIFIAADIHTMGDAYRKLGQLLDEPDRAEEIAKYIEETLQMAETNREKITPVRVYYGLGENGLEANPKGSFHAQVLDLIGLENVVEIDQTAGTNVVSKEQIIQWQPEVLLFDPNSAYPQLSSDAFWSSLELPAYEVPQGPYNWLGRPPSANRYLGVRWLGNLIYPEVYHLDIVKEAQDYYRLFWHYDLSEQEAIELLGESYLK